MALGHTVTHIGGKIQSGFGSVFIGCLGCFLGKLIEMGAAGMALAVGAFNQYLGLFQIFGGPAHAHAQGVHFRGQFPCFLAF